MDLVDDQYRSAEPESAHEGVAHRKNRKQRLVYGADPYLAEKDPLATAGEPLGTVDSGLLSALYGGLSSGLHKATELGIDAAVAVGEDEAGLPEDLGREALGSGQHGIGRCLGREGEDDGIGRPGSKQPPRDG